jgi:uncharacterized delta-60 repeat protein
MCKRWSAVLVAGLLLSSAVASASFGHHGKRVISQQGIVREAIPYGKKKTLLVADLSPSQELLRLRADGSIDRSFGSDGHLDIPAEAVAVRPNGKILVLSTAYLPQDGGGSDAVLTQLLADGSPDSSFGPGGEVVVDFGDRYAEGTAMTLLPSGKIVIGGVSGPRLEPRIGVVIGDVVVARLRPDGRFDTNFGSNGKVALPSAAPPASLKRGPDGSLYLQGGESFHQLIRLNADGTPDSSFGENGATTIPVTWNLGGEEKSFFQAGEWSVLENGGVLVGGTVSWSVNDQLRYKAGVLRLASNGFPKSSYGEGGLVQAGFRGWTFGFGVATTPKGRAVLLASSQFPIGKKQRLAAIGLTSAGKLDRRFGHGGKVRIGFDEWVGGESILLRGGKVLLVGGAEGNHTLLARVPLAKHR